MPGSVGRKQARRLKMNSGEQVAAVREFVNDIDAAIEKLAAAGARVRSRPIKGPGGRQVLVDDPSGNPVELFQPRAGPA
jgi:predicted enzyme related to lactoylglutathione lyase